jgi:oligosaccharide repeat unit polymerase
MTLSIAMVVDILLLVGSLWCILQISDRSIFNPSLWYVVLHAYSVTFRLMMLAGGAQSASFIGVTSDTELVNAAVAADISLLAVVAATICVAHRTRMHDDSGSSGRNSAQLSPRLGQVISILCITIGTYALLKFGAVAMAAKARGADISSVDIGSFDLSSLPRIIAGFAVQGALIQCAMRGFTRWRVVLLLMLLTLSSLNLARAFFVLPALMAILIYQTRRHQRSLSLRWVVALAALGLVWFVFKPVAHGIQSGDDPGKSWDNAQNYFEDAINNGSGDTQFLDMQATYMAAADETGRRFYGATVLPLIYLPIPRFAWPDKPRLNDYAVELATASRPMVQAGMTPTLSGESYLNFGWIGCAVIPFLYIYAMQMAYRNVSRDAITSATRWVYLVFLLSMVQVFRDGLISLILFPLMNLLPWISWGLISRYLPRHRVGFNHFSVANTVPAANRT